MSAMIETDLMLVNLSSEKRRKIVGGTYACLVSLDCQFQNYSSYHKMKHSHKTT